MNIIVWIIFGALAGWIASLIMDTNHEQGAMKNIVLGIAGALLGGFLARLFGLSGVDGFDATSLLVAVAGSVVILAIIKATARQS